MFWNDFQANVLNQMSNILKPNFVRENITDRRLEYERPEQQSNINLSLSQILGLPYQIVMPQPDINQNISFNNLPPLNDLAFRTGLNTGMNTILTSQKSMPAPSPVPITTPQLILPLAPLYSTN